MPTRDHRLDETLRRYLEAWQSNIHTCLIAEVTAVDGEFLTCLPVWNNKVAGKGFAYPPIERVPCFSLGGGDSSITFPVKVGDHCILLVMERALDAWKNGRGVEDPPAARMHNLSDCVALAGIGRIGRNPRVPPDRTRVRGDMLIRGDLEVTGSLKVGGTIDCADCRIDGLSLKGHTHLAPGGATGAPQQGVG